MNIRKHAPFLTRLSRLLLVLTLLLASGYQAVQAAEGPDVSEEAALSGSRQPETLSAGGYHSCGLQSDGTVDCWGSNDNGQSSPPDGTFTQVSSGSLHTCGLQSDGVLACWGNNDYDQATPPAGIFTQVSAGYDHTCGIKSDSSLSCWGLTITISPHHRPGRISRLVLEVLILVR